MFIKIKKEHELAVIPQYQTDGAAAVDLHSVESVYIESGEYTLVSTGLSMEIPKGFVGMLFPRSGNAAKYGITLMNCTGILDSDFRGIVKAIIYNASDKPFIINEGDRICQLMVIPHPPMVFQEVTELTDTDRGENGFGSTGH